MDPTKENGNSHLRERASKFEHLFSSFSDENVKNAFAAAMQLQIEQQRQARQLLDTLCQTEEGKVIARELFGIAAEALRANGGEILEVAAKTVEDCERSFTDGPSEN